MKSNLINSLVAAAFLLGCGTPQKHHKKKHPEKVAVHSWKVKNSNAELNNNQDDDWLFWYIIYTNNLNTTNPGCPCYSYSSPTPVTNFSSLQFSKVEQLPQEVQNQPEEQVQEVEPTDVPEEVETTVDENFDTNDSNEPDAAQEGGESGSESDGGSSGDGGGDGGSGGDGGGGDGGGGGGGD